MPDETKTTFDNAMAILAARGATAIWSERDGPDGLREIWDNIDGTLVFRGEALSPEYDEALRTSMAARADLLHEMGRRHDKR